MNKVAPVQIQGDNSAISLIQFKKQPKKEVVKATEDLKVCKICLEEENAHLETMEDMEQEQKQELRMIVPCDCSGSMAYVHQKCIRTWIEKQLSNQLTKRVECQICKAPFFFTIKKRKEWDCQLKNFTLISCCNIITSIIEFSLLLVIIVAYQCTADQYDTNMLKYILISLMIILVISLVLTIIVMIEQAFIKQTKAIGRIYTLVESIEMGLRQPNQNSFRGIPESSQKIKMRNKKQRGRSSLERLVFNSIVPNSNC